MVKINKELYKARAKIIKALAHWIRMKIVDILDNDGEKCVSELTEILDANQSTVSKHLSILKEAGIIDSKKDGLKVYYSLQTPCIIKCFSCLDKVLTNDFKKKERWINDLPQVEKD